MVLYSNINLNQRIELLYRGEVLKATVKYKGAVTTLEGDWVGVALDKSAGQHNGLYKGRRYFECVPNHGVFVRAGALRFIQNTKRRMFNKYNRRYDTGVDELLFGLNDSQPQVTNGPRDPAYISNNQYRMISPTASDDLFDTIGSRYNSNKFALRGSVSRCIPAATMIRPSTAAVDYTYTSVPLHHRTTRDKIDWEPVPSIPKTHMPHSAQIQQTRRGWDSVPWTREHSYPKARHSMKSTVWNDISF